MATSDFSSGDSELDRIIAQYIEAVERGEKPDVDVLLLAHPEHREALRQFVDDYHRLGATNVQPFAPEASSEPDSKDALAGTLIAGRYKLIENIGEGGMGSVWVAEQKEPVKRKVAIKLIKAGMDSKQVLARFEAERQALALMDHPNIARVFDGGMTEQGRPFFVMEYVKGIPFTEYCDKARLSLKERLELFIPVCQAVQHAHHKGIVHRDLKPSNILICLYDGKPVPKVIDFGLAKAMHQQLTELSLHTAHGVMVGTPIYMSPEQAELNNLDVDTRTDIYSLGVVLYELLTGTTPLERETLRLAAYNEILRLIKEVEPPRPSTRLSGSASLPSVAAQRNIDPRSLQRSLSGDLDWIVMKSLEKERTRRYETATGLQRDVERFLNDEAVEACPPSTLYRLKKYVRKHKPQMLAAGVLLSALLIAIATLSWGLSRSNDAANTVRKSLAEVTKERDAKNEALEAESVARGVAEQELIDGLLRAMRFGDSDTLTTGELRSFVDWAAIADSRLKLRVLEVAFEDPETALRLARRSDRVAQACVTLSPSRRRKVLEFLSAQQSFANTDPRIRTAAAWLALELESDDLKALPESLTWLSTPGAAVPAAPDRQTEIFELCETLASRAGSLSPAQITHTWDALIALLNKTTDLTTADAAGNALVALTQQLKREQMTHAWDNLVAVLENTSDWAAMEAAGSGLVALAPRLSTDQITHAWDNLVAVLENTSDSAAMEAAGSGLVALAPRLSTDQITHAWDNLVAVLENTSDSAAMEAAGSGLVALAPRLSTDQIAHAWDALIAVLNKTTYYEPVVKAAGNALGAMTPKLSPEQITRSGDALIAVIENTPDSDSMYPAANALGALTTNLSPEQITRAGNAIIVVIEKLRPYDMENAGNALGPLSPNLSPEHVRRVWDAIIPVIENSTDPAKINAARSCLVALVPRLSPEQITKAWDASIGIFDKSTDFRAITAAGDQVVALAPRLSPEQITNAWDVSIGIFDKTTDYRTITAAGDQVVALAPRLSPEQIPYAWDGLITVMASPRLDGYTQEAAGDALVAVVPRVSPEHIPSNWESLIPMLRSSSDVDGTRRQWASRFRPTAETSSAAWKALRLLTPKLSPDHIRSGADVMNHNGITLGRTSLVALAEPIDSAALQRDVIAWLHWSVLMKQDCSRQVLPLIARLDGSVQERITSTAMRDNLDLMSRSEAGLVRGNFGFVPAIRASINARSLAKLLQHPACIGEPREWMLQRFEELVLHDGRRVFLKAAEEEDSKTDKDAKSETQTVEGDHPKRRFHTIHDAAAWIQTNWPDFDLEATMEITWRPEP